MLRRNKPSRTLPMRTVTAGMFLLASHANRLSMFRVGLGVQTEYGSAVPGGARGVVRTGAYESGTRGYDAQALEGLAGACRGVFPRVLQGSPASSARARALGARHTRSYRARARAAMPSRRRCYERGRALSRIPIGQIGRCCVGRSSSSPVPTAGLVTAGVVLHCIARPLLLLCGVCSR